MRTCSIHTCILCTYTYIYNLSNGRENVELSSLIWGEFLNEKIIAQWRKFS